MSALRKNMLSLALLQGANYLLPLAAIPYLVRVLGPENYGRIAFAQAFIQYFVMFTDYGFNLTATRAVAQAGSDSVALTRIFNTVLGVKCLIMGTGFVVMSAIAWLIPAMQEQYALLALSYLAVVGNALFPVWLYQGLQRMSYITAFTVSARTVAVIAIFLTVKEREQYLLAAALLAVGMPLAAVGALFSAFRIAPVRLARPEMRDMRNALGEGWHVFTATIGGTLYNSSNVVFLGLLASPAVVGYFAAADKLLKALQSLIYPVSQAAFPHVAVLLRRSKEEAFAFVGRLLALFSAGTLLVSLGLFLGAGIITHVAFGPDFSPTAKLIRLLSPWPVLIALNVIFGALFLVQLDLGKLLSVSILAPALLHLLLLYPVIRFAGAGGVAVLMLFTELLVLLIRLGGLSRTHRHELGLLSSGMLRVRTP